MADARNPELQEHLSELYEAGVEDHGETKSMKELYEEELAARRNTEAVSAELLKDLHESAMADRGAGVAVPAQTLLRLLNHIDELRLDLSRIDQFIRNSQKEEEGYSPAISAWNELVEEFRDVPRLYSGDLTVIREPLIDRMDRAESILGNVEHLARCQVNRYGEQTAIKATKIMAILDGKSVE